MTSAARSIAFISLVTAFSLPVAAEETGSTDYFNEAGYRVELMRSPVSMDIEGVSTLDDPAELESMLESDSAPLLIDVLPVLWRGIFIETDPHYNIPGSYWLPNVGKGELEDQWVSYFVDSLRQLTEAQKDRALVFYCKADCWHSWNAARRALALGYQAVYWYPLGVEGWQDLGLDLELSTPIPLSKAEQ